MMAGKRGDSLSVFSFCTLGASLEISKRGIPVHDMSWIIIGSTPCHMSVVYDHMKRLDLQQVNQSKTISVKANLFRWMNLKFGLDTIENDKFLD
jgi:hypothetical protein